MHPVLLSTSATVSPPSMLSTGGTATVVIPLHVSVSLGTPVAVPAVTVRTASGVSLAPAAAEGRFTPSPPADFSRFSLASLNITEFDWKAALSLALASRLAYEGGVGVTGVAQGTWHFSQCQIISADDTYCFVAYSDDTVLVSFRGTVNLGNWLSNMNVFGTTRPYGVVHRGFLGAFQVVDAQLRNALAGLGPRKLLLTGHSLGGALATVAAAEWQGQFPVSGVYTYGQPAVGAGEFPAFMARHYAGKFFRFVNNNDIVPRVPPGYRHVGRLFRFGATGKLENTIEATISTLLSEAVPVFESPAHPPMMTETEFDLLRAELLQRRVQVRAAGQESVADPMVEGFFPSVSDHDIHRYIARVAAKVT